MTSACPDCLRRSLLIGRLAPRIAGLLSVPPEERVAGVLGLDPDEMIQALVPAEQRVAVEHWLEAVDTDAVEQNLEEAGMDALCVHGEAYPRTLALSHDPPPVLWALGGLDRLEQTLAAPVVTIVGTRRPSPYGREMAYTLGHELAQAGATVVSGLALGIDAAAHRGALDGKGTPIAVVANGPDIPYPRTNADLWRRLAERGVVLSELPPGQRPFRWSFPARNRIMAAVAEVTVVVEASRPSGSHDHRRVRRHARPDHRSRPRAGDLTRGGGLQRATARRCGGDHDQRKTSSPSSAEHSRDLLEERSAQQPPTLDAAANRVLEAVEEESSLEAIGRRARLAASEVRGALARLEGAGLVRRDPLGRYLRRAGG